MNERIKELAEQANMIGDWGEDITKGRYFVFDNLKSLENFAELIVKETMQVVANQLPSNVYLDVANAVIERNSRICYRSDWFDFAVPLGRQG